MSRLGTSEAKKAKAGQMVVGPGDIDRFMMPIAIGALPGIGYRTMPKLQDLSPGITTVGDLQSIELERLQEVFGKKQGKLFYNIARGRDSAEVLNKPPKSVSAEITFGVRTDTTADIAKWLRWIAEEASTRLATSCPGQRARKVTLRVAKAKEVQFEAEFRNYQLMGHGPCNWLTISRGNNP